MVSPTYSKETSAYLPRTFLGVVNPTEPLVEEVIEGLMDVICLAHYHRVSLNG